VLVALAYESGLRPKLLRPLVCGVLQRSEDSDNFSEFPSIDMEIRRYVDVCEWFEVYDVAEAIYRRLYMSGISTQEGAPGAPHFEAELNKYFRRRGIGWQLKDGNIEARGPQAFEQIVSRAHQELTQARRQTASNEIHEAIKDLSRRPQPDVTGAIQPAMASLECVARDVMGNPQATLGELLKRFPGHLPPALDSALVKLWGFASEQGRHLREGRVPGYEEAELVVQVSAAVAQYLSRKFVP
jgi:AbiJ N-terminal domain 4